jgi:hypothetical protein
MLENNADRQHAIKVEVVYDLEKRYVMACEYNINNELSGVGVVFLCFHRCFCCKIL